MATGRVTMPLPPSARDRARGLLSHFGLREQPFGVTPDPGYLFSSSMHRNALQSMIEAIDCNLGFTALLGDPGMGKTTLLFQLLTQYRSSARTAFIFQTQCKRYTLLRHLASEFELAINDDEVLLHRALKEMLVNEAAAGRRVLIIVDEAQNLPASSLEAIRLLSDFETTRAKLLHIILAGSARLSETLQSPELLPLAQRISTVCRLEPLSPEDVKAYVNFRLKVAGFRGAESLFSSEALAEVAVCSAGVPRLINCICYRALSLAYRPGKTQVGKELVVAAARSLDLASSTARVGDVLGTTNDSALIENEQDFVAEPSAPTNTGPQSAAVDSPPTSRAQDPEARYSASSLAPVVSSNQIAFSAPGSASATSCGREATLRESKKGPGPVADLDLPRNNSDYRHQKHAIVPPLRDWISNRATLAIGALGLLALFLWLAWHNPQTQSQFPARNAATANPPPALLESQSRAEKSNLNSSVRQSGAPRMTEQQSTNSSAGGAHGKVLQGRQNGQIVSITDVAPLTSRASKLNTRPDNEVDATIPYDASSGFDLPASPPDLSGMTPASPSKVSLQPLPAAVKAGVPLGKPIKVVKPEYPTNAELRGIEGDVRFEIQVDSTGRVRNVRRISGEPTLSDAAEQAVRQWLYPPFPDDESGHLAVTEVQFNFKLNSETRK